MKKESAEKGDTVKIHYSVKPKGDKDIVDTSRDRDPLSFKIGDGFVIAGLEEAVTGMKAGEKKEVEIPSDKAFGQHSQELVAQVEKKFLPADLELEVGSQLQVGEKDEVTLVTVVKIEDDKVTLDANHPLAGKDLIFDIELLEIV